MFRSLASLALWLAVQDGVNKNQALSRLLSEELEGMISVKSSMSLLIERLETMQSTRNELLQDCVSASDASDRLTLLAYVQAYDTSMTSALVNIEEIMEIFFHRTKSLILIADELMSPDDLIDLQSRLRDDRVEFESAFKEWIRLRLILRTSSYHLKDSDQGDVRQLRVKTKASEFQSVTNFERDYQFHLAQKKKASAIIQVIRKISETVDLIVHRIQTEIVS